MLDAIRKWLRRTRDETEAVARGLEPDAMPPAGSLGEPERETSTNAQMQGARDEPWPGNE